MAQLNEKFAGAACCFCHGDEGVSDIEAALPRTWGCGAEHGWPNPDGGPVTKMVGASAAESVRPACVLYAHPALSRWKCVWRQDQRLMCVQ